MAWWVWVLLGIGLLVVEVATPGGLFALFFGVGALAVAALALAGVGTVAQWLAFTAISVLLLLTLRRTLQARLAARGGAVDSLVGEEVVLLADLPAGGETKAELRGSPWSARAAPGVSFPAGARARVERVDGLVLWLRADRSRE
jgi:membrane protein implicated in regulation of membrane protease activity